jgi:hypothetical protein
MAHGWGLGVWPSEKSKVKARSLSASIGAAILLMGGASTSTSMFRCCVDCTALGWDV